MKNKVVLLIISIGIIVGVTIGFIFHHSVRAKSQELSIQVTTTAQIVPPTVAPSISPGIPKTISIPKIGVNAAVESVQMDSQGRMDVPKNAIDTAWYSPGYRPGMKGSAVIDGHYDRVTGAPAVFWDLKKLTPGDTISITEDNGKTYTFSVDRVTKYPDATFPIKEVFAASAIPMLNLITCNGVWDKNAKNYSDRLVVYSKLIAEK